MLKIWVIKFKEIINNLYNYNMFILDPKFKYLIAKELDLNSVMFLDMKISNKVERMNVIWN